MKTTSIPYLLLSLLFITFFAPRFVHAQAGTGCGPWILVGAATQGASGVTLTTATATIKGAAWASSCIDISKNFNMTFKTYFGAAAGADGINFVLQNDPRGTAAIGSTGGNKGYSGPGAVTPSVAFDLETFTTNGYLGVQDDAGGDICTGVSPSCNYVFPSSICDNTEHTYNVIWDAVGHNLSLVFDGTNVINYNQDLVTNVFSGTTCVYYGFTAATGGGGNNLQYFYGVNCFTSTPTPTNTATATCTATGTQTQTNTPTVTPTQTNTTTPVPTNTPTITATPTLSPTPAASPYLPGPNPFTPTLSTNNTVSFNLPAGHSACTLSIYDLRRWPVHKADFAIGAPVVWDGKDDRSQTVQGGVYLYLLRVDGTTHRGSITVLK